ncbi:hypothetical protein BpHYR1_026022 [Brachionus plicatilis]|uniref:Uncharacterized protein n=1 Tax=Brachionus plicatilis TaxID=10195 RepID=A0A3M7PNB6_BRAPC|nr:hypothetical protein BpHYR1_026022 [Brachionus plicatilis]
MRKIRSTLNKVRVRLALLKLSYFWLSSSRVTKYGRMEIRSMRLSGLLTKLTLFGDENSLSKYSKLNQPMQTISMASNNGFSV